MKKKNLYIRKSLLVNNSWKKIVSLFFLFLYKITLYMFSTVIFVKEIIYFKITFSISFETYKIVLQWVIFLRNIVMK